MNALTNFITRAVNATQEQCFSAPFDPEWRSPCELHQDDGQTFWRPIAQTPKVDFRGLANALETDVHPDIQAYYSSFWSGTLEATSEEGRVSLIQLWNPEDFDRLIGNLIGHALMQIRAKRPFTAFFANTEPDSEYFLSIDNETGRVLLEEPGKPPLRTVEASISEFLDRLTPNNRQPDIY